MPTTVLSRLEIRESASSSDLPVLILFSVVPGLITLIAAISWQSFAETLALLS